MAGIGENQKTYEIFITRPGEKTEKLIRKRGDRIRFWAFRKNNSLFWKYFIFWCKRLQCAFFCSL